jgi:DNA processing protein
MIMSDCFRAPLGVVMLMLPSWFTTWVPRVPVAKIIEGVLGEPVAQRAAQVRLEVFERLAEAAATRFIVPGDDEWPGGLNDLRHAEPIQRRGGEPFGLWLRGPGHLAHLMDRSVAVVGSRAATAYGNGIAADLAADLVEHGVTVMMRPFVLMRRSAAIRFL